MQRVHQEIQTETAPDHHLRASRERRQGHGKVGQIISDHSGQWMWMCLKIYKCTTRNGIMTYYSCIVSVLLHI